MAFRNVCKTKRMLLYEIYSFGIGDFSFFICFKVTKVQKTDNESFNRVTVDAIGSMLYI
jgi:hypothetical protein